MTDRDFEKPPLWADLLLTLWVLAVAVFAFGGTFFPAQIGVYTQAGAAGYALMLLVSVGMLARNYLRRGDNPQTVNPKPISGGKTAARQDTRIKTRKKP